MTPPIIHADAVAFLRDLPYDSVDLVVTDPAYESLEKHRAHGTTTRLTGAWFPIFANDRFDDLLRELYRVLRPGRHLYILCDAETMFVLRPMISRHGFDFHKPIVWDKVAIGMGYHYRARCEFILFVSKPGPNRRLADLGVPDVLAFKRVRGGYPTEKPVELLDVLIRQSSDPGELVIDPFAGSGATGVAAVAAGRRFLGCDVQADAVAAANERIAITLRPDLVVTP